MPIAMRKTAEAVQGLGQVRLDAAFKALASDQRREILRMLSKCVTDEDDACCSSAEVCACKFSERLGLAPSTISHHMTLLRDAGLVSARKDGLWVYYSLERGVLDDVVASLRTL